MAIFRPLRIEVLIPQKMPSVSGHETAKRARLSDHIRLSVAQSVDAVLPPSGGSEGSQLLKNPRLAGKGAPYLLLALASLILLLQEVWLSVYTVDDAFISFRFARNLIEGHGLVFNLGERVEGYTNFLWTMIVAGVLSLGGDPVLATKVLGILANAGTLYVVYRLSVATWPQGSPWFLSMLAVAMLAVNGAFATAAITGLETSLFTFFVAAGVFAALAGELGIGKFWRWSHLSPVFFALSALTRPEGVAIFGASVVFKVLSRSFRLDDLRLCARWVLVFAGIYLPYFAWRVWYYGELLPNTFYAKTGAGLAQFYKGILDLKAFSLTYAGVLFLVALIVLSRRRSPLWLTYITGLTVTFVFLHVYEGGDWIPFYRFLTPALPFYVLVIQEAVRLLYLEFKGWRGKPPSLPLAARDGGHYGETPVSHRRGGASVPALPASEAAAPGYPPGQHPGGHYGRTSARQSLLTWAFGLASLALVGLMAFPSLGMHEEVERLARGQEAAHAELARWLRDEGQGPVALMDIGRIGYISRLPIVDTSGLTDRTIAHAEGGLIDKKFDVGYVLDRQPRFYVLVSSTNYFETGAGPTDFPIEKRTYEDERFHRLYRHRFTLDYGWEIDGKGYYLMVYERK